MNHLSSISENRTIREFAQGQAQSSIAPVADFLAPTVAVPTMSGRYKVYDEKNRFRIPQTLRALGGPATILRFEATDATFTCNPHALDCPIDNLESLEQEGLEDAMKEGAIACAEIAALAHEKAVVDLALAAAGAGTDKTWDDTNDPVDEIDTQILNVIKAAAYGSAMGVGLLFGANAWRILKNNPSVRARFGLGSGKDNTIVPTDANVSQLFCASPKVRTSYMVYDTAPEGKSKALSFVLDNQILIFARKQNPDRRDPSFMKTFRLRDRFMVPGSYPTQDGRGEVAKFDWSCDPRVTNAAAVVRLNITKG